MGNDAPRASRGARGSGEAIGRAYQRVDVLGFECGVPGGRRHDQFRLRPDLVQVEGVLHRADHVVAAVDDDAGNVDDAVGIAQQLVVDLEEAGIGEVVVLDARERQRELRVGMAVGEIGVDVQEARRAFPDAPRTRGGQARGLVVAGQALVEGGDQIAPLVFGNRGDVLLPGFRPRR